MAEMFASVEGLGDMQLSSSGPSSPGVRSTEIAAVLGYTGPQIKGSVVITGPRGLFDKSHPNHAMGMPVVDADHLDWAGEVANQILGRIKNKMASSGVSFAMSTPTAVVGRDMQVRPPKDGVAFEHLFRGALGEIVVHFIAVIAPGVELSAPTKTEVAREGDSLFF
jgi:CheY-specific phosphatase CheX